MTVSILAFGGIHSNNRVSECTLCLTEFDNFTSLERAISMQCHKHSNWILLKSDLEIPIKCIPQSFKVKLWRKIEFPPMKSSLGRLILYLLPLKDTLRSTYHFTFFCVEYCINGLPGEGGWPCKDQLQPVKHKNY